MKTKFLILAMMMSSLAVALAAVDVDSDSFAKSLGGWKKRDSYADYSLSGADYRTYKPETSPTPDGGLFISVRIDHLRGWLASNDHAVLEITVNPKGAVASAQSTIAIQGQSISSDVILGTQQAGKEILAPERAVQVGTDLIANLSAKLLRENIVEAGRVAMPAVLRHNYNRLFQSLRVEGVEILAAVAVPDAPIVPPPPVPVAPAPTTPPPVVPAAPQTTPAPVVPEPAKPGTPPLEIKPYL